MDVRTQCFDCLYMGAGTRTSVKKHIVRVHLDKATYDCFDCAKVCSRKEGVVQHQHHVHSFQNTPDAQCFNCGLVGTRFQVQGHVTRTHMHHEHICDECGKQLRCKGGLMEHILKEHSSRDRQECYDCGFRGTRTALQSHVRRVHLTPRDLRCFECGKSMRASKNSMYAHLLEVHSFGGGLPRMDQTCVCDDCGQKCKRRIILLRHVRVVHYKKCAETFVGRGYRVHQLYPRAPKALMRCDDCPLTSRHRTNLVRHIVHTHRTASPACRPYSCDICEHSTFHKNSFEKHSMKHLGVKYMEKNIVDIKVCHPCNKEYRNRKALMAHVRYVHNGCNVRQ